MIARSLRRNQAFIAGKWISSQDTFAVIDPGTMEKLENVANLGRKECTEAIDAAEAALPAWKRLTGKQRGTYLRRIYELHLEHLDELAELLSYESGKPIVESRSEVLYGASYFEFFAGEASRLYGETIPEPIDGRKLLTWREPVGICGLITPFNFPNAMTSRKLAPALAAGNTTVVKPDHQCPLSTLAIGVLAERAGIPCGVINIVTTDRSPEIGECLTSDNRVRKISFTGSTKVGQILLKACASTVQRTSMELGGNAPFIVFGDADVNAAADGLMQSKFRNAGQTCVCANRVYVHDDIYDEFATAVIKRVNKLKVGWFKTSSDITIGPLINRSAVEKVDAMVRDAEAQGGKVLIGGKRLPELGENFFAPTVITECNADMRVIKEEIFGPIAALVRFTNTDDVIASANSTDVGLAAYFYANSLSLCFKVASELEAGIVGVNTGLVSTEVAPFGGVKHSGMGREGSKHGIEDYTQLKSVAFQFK